MGQAKARGTFEQRLAESLERQRIADEKQAELDLAYRNRMAEARRLRDEQIKAENVEDVEPKEPRARPSMRTGGSLGMGLSAATMVSLAAVGMMASATPSRPKPQKDLRKMTLEDFDNL